MIISFSNKKIEKICNNDKEALKELGNPKIVKNLGMLMYNLQVVNHMEDFYTKPMFKKYNAHELTGDKKGITSLRLDYSYRMTVIVEVKIMEDEITIMEVNKHYDE